jgi:hypothetical protein
VVLLWTIHVAFSQRPEIAVFSPKFKGPATARSRLHLIDQYNEAYDRGGGASRKSKRQHNFVMIERTLNGQPSDLPSDRGAQQAAARYRAARVSTIITADAQSAGFCNCRSGY